MPKNIMKFPENEPDLKKYRAFYTDGIYRRPSVVGYVRLFTVIIAVTYVCWGLPFSKKQNEFKQVCGKGGFISERLGKSYESFERFGQSDCVPSSYKG